MSKTLGPFKLTV
jgi:ATP-binding cassette, sub-family E, member 1